MTEAFGAEVAEITSLGKATAFLVILKTPWYGASSNCLQSTTSFAPRTRAEKKSSG
jgi:hypothetical protein